MAMDAMLGGALLGFQQGQANRLNQLGGQPQLNSGMMDLEIAKARGIASFDRMIGKIESKVSKALTIREELQAEVNEWLPDLEG